MNVYSSISHNSQEVRGKMLIDKWKTIGSIPTTMEYYAAIKRNEVVCATTLMNFENLLSKRI
jgi:hypothetical protein